MLGITLGVLICCLISFLLGRFVFPHAKSLGELGKMSLLSFVLSVFLLILSFAAWRVRNYNETVVSAEPITTINQLTTHTMPDALVVGKISEAQPDVSGSDYAAYLRWSAIGDGNPSDIEYELPELLVEVDAKGDLYVDGFIYDNISWAEAELDNYQYRFIDQGDEVLVAGELYDGNRNGSVEKFLTPTFVFAGDYGEFSAEYMPTLRRTATYAQIVQYFSLAAAGLTLLSPLPHVVSLRRKS